MQNLDFSKKIKKATAHPVESFPPIGEMAPEELREKLPARRSYILWIFLVFVSFSAGIMAGIQWNRVSHIEDNIIRYPDEDRSTSRRMDRSAEKGREGAGTTEDRGDAVSLADMSSDEGGRRDAEERGTPSASGTSSASDASASPGAASGHTGADPVPRLLSSEGRYIIKVGDFPSDRAARLTEALNGLATISSRSPHRCRGVHESVPDRYLTFRTRVKGKKGRENILVGCFTSEKDAREILKKIRIGGPSEAKQARIYEIQ